MMTNTGKYVFLLLTTLLLTAGAAFASDDSQEVDIAEIHDMLEDYLAENAGLLPQAEIRIRSLDVRPLELPSGRLSYEIIPSDPSILNSRRFTFIFRVDDRVVENHSFRAEIEALAPVAVAAGDLRRGVTLGEHDINMVEMDLGQMRNPCLDPQELIGKQLKRSLRLGDAFDRRWIEEPALVHRGDRVSIVVRSGAMELTATGVAREDGAKNDVITIRNASSQKDILCRVAAPGIVQVEL
jgi:flagella basal body P-ring formation protein FlgA